MLPLFVASIFTLAGIFMVAQAQENIGIARYYEWQGRDIAVRQASAEVDRYYAETGSIPASLAALSISPGFEHIKGVLRPWQEMAVSSTLNDGVWQFKRVSVYTQDPTKGQQAANYLASSNNGCGAGDFASGADWCGSKSSIWWRLETREIIPMQITAQRIRQNRLLQKFGNFYSKNSAFPNPGAASATLAATVGYAGTATNCTGTFQWQGVPLDCSDLYSVWGTPVTYNLLSTKHIGLISATPIVNAAGTPLYVSSDFSL